jgi:hypothetical protein
MTRDEARLIMSQNSAAWWDADPTERIRLANENKQLAVIAEAGTFNAGTGKWSALPYDKNNKMITPKIVNLDTLGGAWGNINPPQIGQFGGSGVVLGGPGAGVPFGAPANGGLVSADIIPGFGGADVGKIATVAIGLVVLNVVAGIFRR